MFVGIDVAVFFLWLYYIISHYYYYYYQSQYSLRHISCKTFCFDFINISLYCFVRACPCMLPFSICLAFFVYARYTYTYLRFPSIHLTVLFPSYLIRLNHFKAWENSARVEYIISDGVARTASCCWFNYYDSLLLRLMVFFSVNVRAGHYTRRHGHGPWKKESLLMTARSIWAKSVRDTDGMDRRRDESSNVLAK